MTYTLRRCLERRLHEAEGLRGQFMGAILRAIIALRPKSAPVLFLMIAAGCVNTDPRRDYERARALISERVGASGVYHPGDPEKIEQRVVELLADGLSVTEALQIALLNNPEFQSLMSEIGASRADLAQSALLTNPTVSLGLQFPEAGGLSDITVGFAQQLADLWQIPIRKKIAAHQLERTILTAGQRAVELAAEVRTRCYRVMALDQAVAFATENLELVQRSVALSEAQSKAGEVSEFDVELARSSVLDVREELILTRGAREAARSDLAQILGLSTRVDDIRLNESLPATATPLASAPELLNGALEHRFDVRIAFFDVARSEAALRLEYRRFLPDVQLGVAFERGEQRPLPERKILADTARASIAAGTLTAPSIQSRGERAIDKAQIIDYKLGPTLALSLPIFDQNQAQIAKARIRVLQARQAYAARVDAVAAEIQRATAAARAAAEMLQFQQSEGLPQGREIVAMAEQRYRAGEASLLALIEAQDALLKRRRAYVNSLRDFSVALAQLESALGGRMEPTTAATTGNGAP